MRFTRAVKNADATVKRMGWFTVGWRLSFYLEGDPHRYEWWGFAFTRCGAIRAVGRIMAGEIIRCRKSR